MKKINYLFAVLFSVVLVLVGCQGNNDNNRPSENTSFENTRYNNETGTVNNRDQQRSMEDGNFTNNVRNQNERSGNLNRNTNNTQDRYDVSKEAADRIVDEIDEIGSAYVLTTKNNAYVAATLNNNKSGKNRTTTKGKTNSSYDHVRNTNDRNVTDRTVNDKEEGRRKEDDGTINRRGKTSNETERGDRNTNNNMTNNRQQDDNMTNRQGSNDFDDDLTSDIKEKIGDVVQSVDNDIDNVYVSTSPDFFDLADNYVNDMDNGRPIRGFFDQIGNTIERIFPQNKQ